MFTANKARVLADCTDEILYCKKKGRILEKANKMLPDILKRIEKAANRTDKAVYGIDINLYELYYLSRCNILEDLGYEVISFGFFGGIIIW